MAFIFKTPGSVCWIAGFRDLNGIRRNRSTRIKTTGSPSERAENKRKAQTIAEQFERLARGELQRESEIREVAMQLAALARGNEVETLTVAAFLNSWVERQEKTGKPDTTLSRYKLEARRFLAHLGEQALMPLEAVEPRHVQAYVDSLAEQGLATKSRSNSLKILRIPFAEAVNLRQLSFNPAANVKLGEKIRSTEKAPFTAFELRALLESAPQSTHGKEWQLAIAFGFFCGCRLGDATGRRWEEVDLAGARLKFTPEKTKEPIELPIHPTLLELLMKAAGDSTGLITPSLATPDKQKRARLSKAFARIIRKAGIETTQSGPGVRKVTDKTFHSLRHSLASHLLAADVETSVRMKLTAHEDENVHRRYSHTEFNQLKEALGRVKI